VSPFYLGQGANGYKKIQMNPQVAEEVEKKIIAQGSKLLALHTQNDPLNFPYTEDRTKCASCPFLEVCTKVNYQPLTKQQLRDSILQ